MKKVIALVLALCMVFAMSAVAFAVEETITKGAAIRKALLSSGRYLMMILPAHMIATLSQSRPMLLLIGAQIVLLFLR